MVSYFCKKMQNFLALRLRPQTPVPLAAGGFAPKPQSPAAGGFASRPPLASGGSAPRPPKQPLIANFWLRAWQDQQFLRFFGRNE